MNTYLSRLESKIHDLNSYNEYWYDHNKHEYEVRFLKAMKKLVWEKSELNPEIFVPFVIGSMNY